MTHRTIQKIFIVVDHNVILSLFHVQYYRHLNVFSLQVELRQNSLFLRRTYVSRHQKD